MKLIRFLDDAGNLCQGIYDHDAPETARLMEGDWWGKWRIRNERRVISRLLPPIMPPNILALGLNYRKHADETRMAYPERPVVFLKSTTSVIGHMDSIILPSNGPACVDYEAELAIVIGRQAKNISHAEATGVVFGYTCANDVSARDWQFDKQAGQWARGKSFDTFCPIGPWIVTPDELTDTHALAIRTEVNGVVLQDSSTADMVFDVPAIVSDLSQTMTLLPGTVILTGTPEGVGFTRRPPRFLKDGDIVSIWIESVGELINPVTLEE
jgi:2-keto-4-pentenoate hydratase/2-oxohepta-3-ene-1,7-dioic acid hydratase in catechol pathway